MRRSSPVQQWLDSFPLENDINDNDIEDDSLNLNEDVGKDQSTNIREKNENNVSEDSVSKSFSSSEYFNHENFPNNGKLRKNYSVQSEGRTSKPKNPLLRDYSLQSDGSGSSGSSVLNVLGSRKVDAEEVLLALGFGPSEQQKKVQRIPERFLVPSKLKGISTEKFIKEEQLAMRMHDCGVFGYRGLTGNPHAPPSTIVAKIMECILQNNLLLEDMVERKSQSIPETQDTSREAYPAGSHLEDHKKPIE